jgi:hypothetical protein
LSAIEHDASLDEFRRQLELVRDKVPGMAYREELGGQVTAPTITVQSASGGRVLWNLLPDQALFEAFVFVLEAIVSGRMPFAPEEIAVLQSLDSPLTVSVYLARWCPSSAKAASLAGTLVMAQPSVRVSMVDAEALPPEALPSGLSSVPMVVVEPSTRLYGEFNAKELVSALRETAAGRGESFTLGHMLDNRLGKEALELVRQRLLSVEALAGLVGSANFSLRLGTIYLLSELAREDRGLAGEALPVLHDLLGSESAPIRGDALYALAEVGDLRSLAAVEELLADQDEEVRSAAEEAREKIRSFNVWGTRM